MALATRLRADMASEALTIRAETPEDDDYHRLSTALEASARGRAFLSEYTRRNRNADTGLVLRALDELSAQMRADATAIAGLHSELRTLLTAIRLARPEIESGRPPGKVAMLTALVDLLERRIDGLVDDKGGGGLALDAPATAPRPQLAVVPVPDEPELPIPSPPGTQTLAIAVVAAQARQAA